MYTKVSCVVLFDATKRTINIPKTEYKLIIYLQSIQSKSIKKELKIIYTQKCGHHNDFYIASGFNTLSNTRLVPKPLLFLSF